MRIVTTRTLVLASEGDPLVEMRCLLHTARSCRPVIPLDRAALSAFMRAWLRALPAPKLEGL